MSPMDINSILYPQQMQPVFRSKVAYEGNTISLTIPFQEIILSILQIKMAVVGTAILFTKH
jgi:hypothetical protein